MGEPKRTPLLNQSVKTYSTDLARPSKQTPNTLVLVELFKILK